MKRLQWVLPFLTLLLVSIQAKAQTLSLTEFVTLAEKHDFNFQRILIDRDQLSFLIDAGLPNRQITLALENEYGFSSSGDGNTAIITGSVSKELIETGTQLSVSHTHTKRPDRREDVTQIRVEQALYKNLLGRDVRLKKQALKDEEQLLRLKVLENYETYLQEILGYYFDYKKAFLDQQLAHNAYQDALKLNDFIKQKRFKQIAKAIDVDRSDLFVLVRKEDLLKAQQTVADSWETIQKIIGPQAQQAPETKTVYFASALKQDLNKLKLSLATLRSMQMVDLEESIAQKDVLLSKRDNYPELNLIGGYNIDNSERFSSTVNRHEAVFGFQLEIPLWDTQGKAALKKAQYENNKIKLDKKLLQRSLTTEQERLKSLLKTQQAQILATEKKITLMQRIIHAENTEYNFGKIDIDQVLETKSDLITYQYQKQTERVAFEKSYIHWLALTDQLLTWKNNFQSNSQAIP